MTCDLLEAWLPELDSVLLVYDWGGRFRSFLGADPALGYQLKDQCELTLTFERSFVISPAVYALSDSLSGGLNK